MTVNCRVPAQQFVMLQYTYYETNVIIEKYNMNSVKQKHTLWFKNTSVNEYSIIKVYIQLCLHLKKKKKQLHWLYKQQTSLLTIFNENYSACVLVQL